MYKHIIGWSHPELLFLLKKNRPNGFFYCTFRVVPRGFSQLMITMIYATAYNMYVPVFYTLLQSKSELTYWNAVNSMKGSVDYEINFASVTCDFELALIEALKKHFWDDTNPEPAQQIFCLFHFQQANKRKLQGLHLPREQISVLLRAIRTLTVIPANEVVNKGIPFIRSRIDESRYHHIYEEYWKYFKRTWTERYNIEMWNIHRILHLPNCSEILVNLTNNPLERFNKRLNDAFKGIGRPKMAKFVEVIREISVSYVNELQQIKSGKKMPPLREAPNVPVVPAEYWNFTVG